MTAVRLTVGLCLWSAAVALAACAGAKPCPLVLEADYTKAIVNACADAGSAETCKPFPAIKAEHELEQLDAGCRVKP